MTPVTEEGLTRLYVAFFDRAPKKEGIDYWLNDSNLYSLEEISQSFFDQPETKEKYPDGVDGADFVTAVYENLFGRPPEEAGLTYWLDALQGGEIPKQMMVLAIVSGAQDTEKYSDKTILDNKTEVAIYYAEQGLDQIFTLDNITADPESVTEALATIEEMAAEASPETPEDTGGGGGGTVTTPLTATLSYSIDGGVTWQDTIAVKDADTLIIRATFNKAIEDDTGASIEIDNDVLAKTAMTKVSDTVYEYTLDVPGGDIAEARVTIEDATAATGQVVSGTPIHGTFTIDNTDPLAPTIALAHDTGDSDTDGITSDGTVNVTLSDTADSWQYTTDDGTTWHDGSGTSFLLPEGTYGSGNIYVREIDAAGNVSPLAGLGAVTVDTTPPDAPTVALANDTGESSSDGISSDGTVNVTLSDAADSWEYSVDGGATWEEGSGTSFTLAEGEYTAGTVLAREFDDAGNASTPADLGATLIDQTAPAAPTITGLTPETDTGLSDSDNITNNLRPSVQGEAEAGSTVQLTSDGDIIGTAEADSDGHWVIEIDTSLSDGITTVEAMAVDRAGNLSDPSAALDIQVDTAPPAAPAVALANDTGESSDDGITNDGTMNVTLSSDTAYWQYSYDEGATWQDGSGNSFVLPEGEYDWGTIRVKAFDAAGNAVTTYFGDIKVDTTAATPTPVLAQDTGLSDSDGITKNGVIGVNLGDPDDSWEYSIDGGTTWNTGDSTNSFLLPEGSYDVGTILVKESDLAGNVSAPVALDRAVTVDITPPTVTGFSAELDGLHFVSNEDGAAMLLTSVANPESAVASVDVTAGTATILDAPTQAAVTSTFMSVYDVAGNYDLSGFVILPTEGDDVIDGTDLDEIFYARGGTDTLSGDAGTDTFVVTDGSQAWLSDVTAGETLLVGVGATATIQNGGLDDPTLDLSTLARVENQGTINLIGSDGDDTIVGTDGTDCAWGGLGVDTIHTGAGDDTLLIVGVTDSDQYDETDMVCGLDPSQINGHTTSDSGSDGSGETYDGGDGTDTVQIYGTVDTSEATFSGIENYVIHSSVTLPASVAAEGVSITGNGGVPGAQEGVVGFEGSGSVDLSGVTFSNLSQLSIGTGLDATMDPEQLTGMGAIAVEGDATEQGSLSGISASDLGGMYVYGLGSIGGEAINDPDSAFYDPANGVMPLNTIVEGLHAMVDGTNAVLSSFSMPTVDTTNLTVEALQLMMGDLQNDNTLAGNDGIDLIVTGDGNDTIDAGNGLNFVASGMGDDTITGGAQSDFVAADLDVTPDNYGNLMTALQNNDYSVLMGDANGGNDVIATGEGDDFILPGSGSDQVFGDYGNDYIVMGQWLDSSDTIDGGVDNDSETYTDVLILSGTYTSTAFTGVSNMEVLLLDSQTDSDGNLVGSEIHLDSSANGALFYAIIGSTQSDILDLTGYGSDITGTPLSVMGGGGDDTIYSGASSEDISGGTGNDTFIINAATDSNGDVIQQLILDFAQDDDGDGWGDSDILQVADGAGLAAFVNSNYIATAETYNEAGYYSTDGGMGGVLLSVNEGFSVDMSVANVYNENNEYDHTMGYTIAAGFPTTGGWNSDPSTLIGSNADDFLFGSEANDILGGNLGDDLFRGGPGNDLINAGDSDDTLVYTNDVIIFESSASDNGTDDIINYSGDKDMLDLSAFAGNDASHKEDLDSATITTTDEMVYYLLGNSSGLPSDVTDTTIVADAINATATITDADATAWIVVVEDGSDGGDDRSRTAVYEWTDTADSGDGVAASELTLVALMDDYITSDLMLYVG